jgi:ABC-type Fe3+-hydroxamate transport system substrate-binding protein
MQLKTRTPAITAALTSLAFTLMLTGCTTSSTATAPTATSSSSSSAPTTAPPTSTPVQETDRTPDTVVISTNQLQLVFEDGTVAQVFQFIDPVGPVVEALTDLFGMEPAVDLYDGTGPADYEWTGFRVGTDGPTDTPNWPETYVTATATEINGISIESAEGHQVGDDLQALAAATPDLAHRWQSQTGEELYVPVQLVPYEAGIPERSFHTQLTANPADGPITSISAPRKNFE